MQNAALAAFGYELRYTRIHVRPEELAEALQLAARHEFIGVNLTIPHKRAALALVDAVDPGAAALGVINTVRMERIDGGGTRLRGFNTDGPGFERAIDAEFGVDLAGLRVLILGAGGGAGRALAKQCVGARCGKLFLVNRTFEKAELLARELRPFIESVDAVPWDTESLRRALMETDLVVNTSSLGLKMDDASPLPSKIIPTRVRIFDTVYRASGEPTPLVVAAREAGAQAVDGMSLLLHQGALSFEHWFGVPAPLEAMRHALP